VADVSLRHVQELVNEVLEGGKEQFEPLLRRALKAALSALMEGEVTEQIGAGYGERSSERVTHRNGYRQRRFDCGLGSLSLNVPRIRQGSYFPSFLTARERSDDALRLALAECFVQGVSTRKAEAIAQALGIESLSKSTASRMAERLDPQVEAFRKRCLPACPYVWVDARYEFVREDHAVRKFAVLVALGVRQDGVREVLGMQVSRVENEAYWADFLADLRHRGLRDVRLVVSDAHEGLKRAIAKVLPGALWQRCKVHFLRNLGSRMPKRKRPALLSLAKSIFAQDSLEAALSHRRKVVELFLEAGQLDAAELLESADEVLTYMQFPQAHWSKLHSTNVVERLNRELKRRTRVVSIFPNRASLLRLVGALLLEEHEEWAVGRRYISERSMKQLQSPRDQLEDLSPGASRLLPGHKPQPETERRAA
jgi:transposase-like protein